MVVGHCCMSYNSSDNIVLSNKEGSYMLAKAPSLLPIVRLYIFIISETMGLKQDIITSPPSPQRRNKDILAEVLNSA